MLYVCCVRMTKIISFWIFAVWAIRQTAYLSLTIFDTMYNKMTDPREKFSHDQFIAHTYTHTHDPLLKLNEKFQM